VNLIPHFLGFGPDRRQLAQGGGAIKSVKSLLALQGFPPLCEGIGRAMSFSYVEGQDP